MPLTLGPTQLQQALALSSCKPKGYENLLRKPNAAGWQVEKAHKLCVDVLDSSKIGNLNALVHVG